MTMLQVSVAPEAVIRFFTVEWPLSLVQREQLLDAAIRPPLRCLGAVHQVTI